MEGHVEAFRVLGGVPTRHIRYDNLKPAVRQVLFGRGRLESTGCPPGAGSPVTGVNAHPTGRR